MLQKSPPTISFMPSRDVKLSDSDDALLLPKPASNDDNGL